MSAHVAISVGWGIVLGRLLPARPKALAGVVAGLGNIYASEALHLAKLSPLRLASTIATSAGRPRPAAVRLVAAIKTVLRRAIRLKATDDYSDVDAASGTYVSLPPSRVLDTRSGLGGTTVGPNAILSVQVGGRGGVPATGVSAVVLNVTAAQPTSTGTAPAAPPITMFCGLRGFSQIVYTNT